MFFPAVPLAHQKLEQQIKAVCIRYEEENFDHDGGFIRSGTLTTSDMKIVQTGEGPVIWVPEIPRWTNITEREISF